MQTSLDGKVNRKVTDQQRPAKQRHVHVQGRQDGAYERDWRRQGPLRGQLTGQATTTHSRVRQMAVTYVQDAAGGEVAKYAADVVGEHGGRDFAGHPDVHRELLAK